MSNSAALAKAISEKLPSWVYWYIPAGHLGGNPIPMFLNQGKALFFVKPTPDSPIPVMPHVASRAKPGEKPIEQAASTQNDNAVLPEHDEKQGGDSAQVQSNDATIPKSDEKTISQAAPTENINAALTTTKNEASTHHTND